MPLALQMHRYVQPHDVNNAEIQGIATSFIVLIIMLIAHQRTHLKYSGSVYLFRICIHRGDPRLFLMPLSLCVVVTDQSI